MGFNPTAAICPNEIEEDLKAVSDEWGIVLTRVEILEVDVDVETKQAMQLQLNA